MSPPWIPVPMCLMLVAAAASGCVFEEETRPPYAINEHILWATPDHPVQWATFYVAGRAPLDTTFEALSDTLEEVNGAGSSRYIGSHMLEVEDTSAEKEWTTEEFAEMEQYVATHHASADFYFFFLNGKEQPREDVPRRYGFALMNSAYIFVDKISGYGRAMHPPDPVRQEAVGATEKSVAVHELGHLIGLVDRGTPMLEERIPPKEDDPCQCHSNQRDSVMYYENVFGDVLLENVARDGSYNAYRFNEADWRDIRAHQATLKVSKG